MRPPDPPATAVLSAPAPRARVPWGWRVAWGLTWRYGVLGAVVVGGESTATTPWPALVGLVVVGLALGLLRRGWLLARVWRTTVLAAGVVFVAPGLALYGDAVVGSIGALTAAPFLATWRRRTRW